MVATRCTVILTCLNAHEFVRRQLLHLDRVIGGKLASLVRVVLLDDGSQVPIPEYSYPWLTQIWTHDTRPWTQGMARNIGARAADSPYLLFTDIDHILSSDAINYAARFSGEFALFRRRGASLDENGCIVNIRHRDTRAHVNTYLIRRGLFFQWGGYAERPMYADDRWIRNRYERLSHRIVRRKGPRIYVCTDGSFFHKLKRRR